MASLDDDLKNMLNKFQKDHEPYLYNTKQYTIGAGTANTVPTTTTAATVMHKLYVEEDIDSVASLRVEIDDLKKRIVELGEMIALLHIMMGVENKKQ